MDKSEGCCDKLVILDVSASEHVLKSDVSDQKAQAKQVTVIMNQQTQKNDWQFGEWGRKNYTHKLFYERERESGGKSLKMAQCTNNNKCNIMEKIY